jgi:riboflavin kinase, archaea type
LPTLTFFGTVFSGKGEGKKFVALPWVKRQVEEKAGFTPFEGTLNVRLTDESVKQKILLSKVKKIIVEPAQGYCPGYLIKAQIGNISAVVVLPEVPNYPPDVLEVVAPVCLRKKLGLADGSCVSVTVLV